MARADTSLYGKSLRQVFMASLYGTGRHKSLWQVFMVRADTSLYGKSLWHEQTQVFMASLYGTGRPKFTFASEFHAILYKGSTS
jgi:hypothetical protein